MHKAYYASDLGPILLDYEKDTLYGLSFVDQLDDSSRPAQACPELAGLCQALGAYFIGQPERVPQLNLCAQGSPFQERVWQLLREIPYGQVTTYGDLARTYEARYQTSMSAQAIGGAVGRNPIALLIPCHRVLSSRGQLTGYAYGVPRKQALLEAEGLTFDERGRMLDFPTKKLNIKGVEVMAKKDKYLAHYERSRQLASFRVKGFRYYDGLDVIQDLDVGASVDLLAEPDNPYDGDAVQVAFKGNKLGYLPADDNHLLSQLLYFGHGNILEARILSVDLDKNSEPLVTVQVRIKDKR
ncbi:MULTISPECIES: methylated-DNA--[protein]-cysteine S-methyltransferase [Aerococcus]|uniref:methylated-DNA--[protein]-cysteine S-methyltransferase n=1 Tax=Aerococcus sanguinicola TaxID=119206 RepID=A0A5N1GQ54_9LACT|nr:MULTISPECIES: methylated-DNA--[protein]-cysteine S-methyltransferase [Aerococcus]KAA9302181.1 methylated-DNA--[protein]-cysteine S-methyltransferase [Aerococcus sanguinicola]MDK6679471.1 methylated-DNA--[protein]-cysteine S-methyltransferase [Aerococcus sp. UMB8608]MDK6687238.1 methylated-DNA--[protein]-cysteine S-methyltransferase [Aerococcus sp. UMB8623]MDK6941064.1 methylated-DNA--[protein]-cysteine S-methyltransferase [Aerococcus sp. UMB8487]OFK21109.1 hypothetical protein HMPREF2829_06